MPLFGPLQTDSLLAQFRPGPQGRPPLPGGLQTRGLVNFVSSSPKKFNANTDAALMSIPTEEFSLGTNIKSYHSENRYKTSYNVVYMEHNRLAVSQWND